MLRGYNISKTYVVLCLIFTSMLGSITSKRPWAKFLNAQSETNTYPVVQHLRLSDQIDVYYIQDNIIPRVNCMFYVEGGLSEQPGNQVGLQNLWGNGISYSGSKTYNKEKLADILEHRASTFSFHKQNYRSSFLLSSLSHIFESDLKIILDVLNNPLFHKDDIILLKKQMSQSIKKRKENPYSLALLTAQRTFWKNNFRSHIYTEETITNIQRQDLLKWHAKMWSPKRLTIAITGKMDIHRVLKILEKHLFSSSKVVKSSNLSNILPHDDVVSNPTGHLYYVPKDISQSTLIWKAKSVNNQSTDYFALYTLNFLLGGDSFNSILTQKIRVEKGWAYMVYSQYTTDKYHGTITLAAQSQNKNVNNLITYTNQILTDLPDMVQEDQLLSAKKAIQNKFVFLYDNYFDFMNTVLKLKWNDYPSDYLSTFTDKINNVTIEEIKEVAELYYKPSNFMLTIVGPKDNLKKSSSKYKVTYIDAEEITRK